MIYCSWKLGFKIHLNILLLREFELNTTSQVLDLEDK